MVMVEHHSFPFDPENGYLAHVAKDLLDLTEITLQLKMGEVLLLL
jgi:hypothetical protein